MKLTLPRNVSNLTDLGEVSRFAQLAFDDLDAVINGNIQFGENILTKQVDATFIGADTDLAVSHGLGRAPTGYIVVGLNVAAIVYDSPTANTADTIYLRCNTANAKAKVMVY